MAQEFFVMNLVKFEGKTHLKVLWEKKKKRLPGTENPLRHNVATLFRFQNAAGQTLHVKQIGWDVSLLR